MEIFTRLTQIEQILNAVRSNKTNMHEDEGGRALDLHLAERCPQNPLIFDLFRNFRSMNIPGFEISFILALSEHSFKKCSHNDPLFT